MSKNESRQLQNDHDYRFLNVSYCSSTRLTLQPFYHKISTLKLSHTFKHISSTFVYQTILLTCCISIFLTCFIQCDSNISIPSDTPFYDKLSYTPTFGTYKLLAQYAVEPSNLLRNISFSLMYLNENSFQNFQTNPTPFLSGSIPFDGEFDIFNYNSKTFNNNLIFNFGSLVIMEMKFNENTNRNRYRFIIMIKGEQAVSYYRLIFSKFELIQVPRLYDRGLTGRQTVEIPNGMTENFICDICSSTYIDVNNLDAKASFTVTVSPVADGYVTYITIKLSNTFDTIFGSWSLGRTFVLKNSVVSLNYETNMNSITDLYIQVTAINCTFNGQVMSQCPFAFNVKPNNKRNLSYVGGDTAIVVTAIILSTLILFAIVLSTGYFYYRYRMSRRYEETRLTNLRDVQSRAQMAFPNDGSNVHTMDESQRPNDPFVRLDKIHGYSLDSSTHFVMDAIPKVTINLSSTTQSTQEPAAIQYGVDTKRLSHREEQRVDAPIKIESVKLEMQNEKDYK